MSRLESRNTSLSYYSYSLIWELELQYYLSNGRNGSVCGCVFELLNDLWKRITGRIRRVTILRFLSLHLGAIFLAIYGC